MNDSNNKKMITTKKIDIVYCTDDNFVDVCCTSIVSLLENKGEEQICLHIIDNNISKSGKMKIQFLSSKYVGVYIEFVPFPNLDSILQVKVKYDRTHISISTFGRLFLQSNISNQIDRIIYLDCDTIVMKSLVELYEFDLKGYIIGGVDDCKSWKYRKVLGLKPNAKYVNAGVLLIDMNKWRQCECEKRIINYISEYNGVIHFEDQGVINAALNQFLFLLPMKFNIMTHNFDMSCTELMKFRNPVIKYTSEMIEEAINNSCIIHFTSSYLTRGRVWNIDTNHKKKKLYYIYMRSASVVERKYILTGKKIIENCIVNVLPRKAVILIAYIAHELLEPMKFFFIMRVAKHEKRV